MASIFLPPALRRQIVEHAASAPDEEVCGLIGGRSRRPATYYPIRNDAAERRTRFLLDAQEQVDAMRRMRERGETLLGIFHSHPDSPPVPSAVDREFASYPEVVYVIAGPEGGAPGLRAYYYDGKTFTELALE